MNEMPSHFGEKRYFSLNDQFRQTFETKIIKIPLDGGFDCPNRDGRAAYGGCTFCSASGSGDFAGSRTDAIEVQFRAIKERTKRKWKDGQYIAYFQAFTNTYAPVAVLRGLYERVLEEEGVVGLSIATRPDCLPDDVLDYLSELNERTYLWVELGLQTAHDETGRRINRAHDFKSYVEGVGKLRARGIRVCSHIINGLPGETPEMMRETARQVAKLDVQGIKIHLLHVLKGTPMAKQLEKGEFELMTQLDYVSVTCDQLELLPPDVGIHRLTGDGPADLLIGPMWSAKKFVVLNAIRDELVRRDSWQGKNHEAGVEQ